MESTLSNAQHQGCCQPWGGWTLLLFEKICVFGGSNDFWAGIDVACILHNSWEGLPFAPAMASPAFSTIVGQDCHLLQEPLAHMLGTKETNKAKSKEAENEADKKDKRKTVVFLLIFLSRVFYCFMGGWWVGGWVSGWVGDLSC